MFKYDEKLKIVEEFYKSGATIKGYASTWNISVPTFRKWLKTYETYGPEGLKTKWDK